MKQVRPFCFDIGQTLQVANPRASDPPTPCTRNGLHDLIVAEQRRYLHFISERRTAVEVVERHALTVCCRGEAHRCTCSRLPVFWERGPVPIGIVLKWGTSAIGGAP